MNPEDLNSIADAVLDISGAGCGITYRHDIAAVAPAPPDRRPPVRYAVLLEDTEGIELAQAAAASGISPEELIRQFTQEGLTGMRGDEPISRTEALYLLRSARPWPGR